MFYYSVDCEYPEVLDRTRIHPENYDWAKRMAIDALDARDSLDSEDAGQETLDNIFEAPHKLDELDLSAYAAELLCTVSTIPYTHDNFF